MTMASSSFEERFGRTRLLLGTEALDRLRRARVVILGLGGVGAFAAEAAARAGVIAEINTGGIARGALDDVYPSAMFLKLLYQAGVPVMINSDAHHAQDLDCAFDRARQCAADAGYRETVCLRRAPGGGTIRQSIPLYQH